MADPITVAINLLYSAEAWRKDATRYTGSRRAQRLAKAAVLEQRAAALAA